MDDRIHVQMPDGTIIDAPAGTTKEQIAAKYTAMGKPLPAAEGPLDTVARWGKNIGTGLAKGWAGLATLAGDAFADDPQINMAVQATGGKQPQVGDVSRLVAGMGYQPKTEKERLVQAMSAGVGAGLSGPGALINPGRAAAIGMGGAVGAETASHVSNGNTAATIAGGVLGGGLTGLGTSLRGNAPKLAAEALRDVKPADLEAAKAAMADAQRAGIPVNLSQAMPAPSNIYTIVDALANSRYGTKVTQQLRAQPGQVAFGMEDKLAGLPGEIRAPQIAANNAQEVATGVIHNAKKARQTAWKNAHDKAVLDLEAAAMGKKVDVKRTTPLVDEAGKPLTITESRDAMQMVGQMPEQAVDEAYKRLRQLAAERPNTGVAGELTALSDRLRKGDKYITDTYQLNEILKDASARLKSPNLATQGVDAGGTKFLANTINELRDGWGEKFAPYRAANAEYARMTDEVVNPLKKSVVGDLAGRRGALPDVEAAKTKLMNVFNNGTTPGSKSSEILTMEKSFRGIPESEASVSGAAAYQDAVKTWMAQKVSEASKMKAGRVDDAVAAHLEQTFMGNDTRAQGFRDMLVGLARSQGKPDSTYVKGMENFLRVTSMAARRPGTVQGVSQQGAAEIAGRTVANAGGATTINPMRNLMLRWSERLQSDAYREMDRLLTSPEGVDMLQKLAKAPVMSRTAQTAVATFLSTGQQVGQLEANSPGNTGE